MSYRILTIEREFGTGGYEIAMRLSKELQIPFYDHNIIRFILKNDINIGDGVPEQYIHSSNSLLYNLATYTTLKTGYLMEVDDEMANQEFGIVREISEHGPCIIVGRCSNHILQHRKDIYSVYIKGDLERKIQRIQKALGEFPSMDIKKMIEQTDIARKEYYLHHTGKDWSDEKHYDKVFDLREVTEDEIVNDLKNIMTEK